MSRESLLLSHSPAFSSPKKWSRFGPDRLPATFSLPQTPVTTTAVTKCVHRCPTQTCQQARLAQRGEQELKEVEKGAVVSRVRKGHSRNVLSQNAAASALVCRQTHSLLLCSVFCASWLSCLDLCLLIPKLRIPTQKCLWEGQ